MLKLRTLLLCDYVYLIIFFISIIYIIINNINYVPLKVYNINDKNFTLKINKINIDGNKLTIDAYGLEHIRCNYYFDSEEDKNNFKSSYNLGDYIDVYGSLSIPKNNTIPNTFNYKEYLKYNNINYILSIKKISLNTKNSNIFYSIKNSIIKSIDKLDNEYLYAFILGNTSYIEEESYNNYRINGVTHLVALSGLHVSIFSSIILFILNRLKCNEKFTFIIVSIFLIIFSFIASFTPSILRATIFFILSSINTIYYFFIKPKNLLYLTFSIMIFINPFYLFDLGFILSFTITYFILLFNESYKINNKYKSILYISFISFLSSMPIIINNFYEINIIGFINNIIFIPLVTNIVFPLSILTIIFNFLNPILRITTNILEFLSSISSLIININITFSRVGNISIIIYYFILIVFIKYKKKGLLFLLLLLLMTNNIIPSFDNKIHIYYIDVNQGDSILIKTKDNETILIDTGGEMRYEEKEWKKRNRSFNLMKSSIIPFFNSIGIKKIDYLILTHGDDDHMGYSIDLVNNYKVKNVIFNTGNYNSLEQELIKILEEKNIKYYKDLKVINNIFFLNTKDYGNENDNSNVLYFEYSGVKLLFMGDAGVKREKDIIKKYNLKDVDILKVGHHGSDTSSSEAFINYINPKTCIISLGLNNLYNHPKESVLLTLKGCKIYRTDTFGTIEIIIDNNKYKIKNYY